MSTLLAYRRRLRGTRGAARARLLVEVGRLLAAEAPRPGPG
jgi:hypothetical protein